MNVFLLNMNNIEKLENAEVLASDLTTGLKNHQRHS